MINTLLTQAHGRFRVVAMPRIAKINLADRRTTDSEDFDLFSPNDKSKGDATQVCLVYGRNGAGKSTLAKDIAESFNSGDCVVSSHTGESWTGTTDSTGNHIRVSLFNEQFAGEIGYREGVSDEGHLNTIVLLGEQKQYQDKIDQTTIDLENVRTGLSQRRDRISKIAGNGGEVTKLTDAIKDALRIKDGWSDSRKQAHQQGTTPRVTESIISSLIDKVDNAESDAPNLEELVSGRKQLLADLAATRERRKVDSNIAAHALTWDLAEVQQLLETLPESPDLDAYGEYFSQVLTRNEGREIAHIAKKSFLDSDAEQCPTCTQPIPGELRDKLRRALSVVFGNDKRDELVQQLRSLPSLQDCKVSALDNELISVLSDQASADYETARTELNRLLEEMRSAVNAKIAAPEILGSVDAAEHDRLAKNFETSRQRCLTELARFNARVEDRKQLLARFDDLNLSVAAATDAVAAPVRKLKALNEERTKLEDEKRQLELEDEALTRQLRHLQAENENFSDAVELMNKYLSVVFADPGRLVLEPAENSYLIKSRGADVPLSRLSTGERNIISLVYFLARIFERSDDHRKHRDRRFIILDDPISSFDRENRFGVVLLLRQVLGQFLKGNSETQLLILSHDLGLIQDFEAVLKTIDDAGIALRQIEANSLSRLNLPTHSDYDVLLAKIYDFASKDNPRDLEASQIPTGNEMRLVLESFGAFLASAGIIDLPKIANIKALFTADQGRYFEGALYKLLLHGESHSADDTRAGKYGLGAVVTPEERQSISQDLLVLMSVVAPSHVPAKLRISVKGRDRSNPRHHAGYHQLLDEWKASIEARTL